MQIFMFVVGLIVSIMVIYGIFSQIPGEIRGPDKVIYRSSKEENE
jgi:hypothetical protein